MMMNPWLHLSHLACLIVQGASTPLHLNIINNLVPITLDGHTVKLFLDSATPRCLVLSGEAYEKSSRAGACRELATGCYFCPPTLPCDDIYKRPRRTIKFADGDDIEYVEHTGTLSIGNVSDIEVKFGLIISFKSPRGGPPMGILGLALGTAKRPSMLDQLKMHGVIEEVSVAVEASETESAINGRLFLGDSPQRLAELSPVKFTTHPSYCPRCVTVLRSELKPVDRRSQLAGEGSARNSSNLTRQWTHVVVDTGAAALDLTQREYELMLSEMKDRMQEEGNPLADPIWVGPKSLVWVDARAFNYLPELGFYLMDDSGVELTSVRISPKHYVRECFPDKCALDLYPTTDEVICLGHPFFRAYYTYFDLNNKMLFITPNGARHSTSVRRSSPRNTVETPPCSGSAGDSSLTAQDCGPPYDQDRVVLQRERNRSVVAPTRKAHNKGLEPTRRPKKSKRLGTSRAGCIQCAIM